MQSDRPRFQTCNHDYIFYYSIKKYKGKKFVALVGVFTTFQGFQKLIRNFNKNLAIKQSEVEARNETTNAFCHSLVACKGTKTIVFHAIIFGFRKCVCVCVSEKERENTCTESAKTKTMFIYEAVVLFCSNWILCF